MRDHQMPDLSNALTLAQIDAFIADGFVRIDNAFSEETAAQCRDILWKDLGVDRNDPKTWTKPVIRLNQYGEAPFREAANTPVLRAAYDQLAGAGRWEPRQTLGTFPVRFPSPDDPGDAGWHVDASFGYLENPDDFMAWRVNVNSKGRLLLMLFIFSEVGEDDAPTRIRVASHLDIARMLAPAGDAGLSYREMRPDLPETEHRPQVLAIGSPGTVYLCHPFLAHAAQPHRGTRPKFMAQPPLQPREQVSLDRTDGAYSPVEVAIRQALGR